MIINAIMILVVLTFVSRLWYLQVKKGPYYYNISENNRIAPIEIPAPRGQIYDRNGIALIKNSEQYDLVVIPQFVTNLDETLNHLSSILGIDRSSLQRNLKNRRRTRIFAPITLRHNLTLHQRNLIEDMKFYLPGVDIIARPGRNYPRNSSGHLLGYLGEIDQNSLTRLNQSSTKNKKYFPGDLVGKYGLERRWEEYLSGDRGHTYTIVDVHGKKVKEQEYSINFKVSPAKPGNDLILNIDSELQNEASKAFKGRMGAIVVLDPTNGSILTLLSEPSFDPSLFQGTMHWDQWRALNQNPFTPLLDKTSGAVFPPGSIYKLLVAAAALEEKTIIPSDTVKCLGSFRYGKDTYRCHKRSGHGVLNLLEALRDSCDVYFYETGLKLGVDRIAHYARAFGFGSPVGVELNMERPGLVPSSDWYRLSHKKAWPPGETPNLAIGQGFNLQTPIQMATFIAAIANEGTIWKPRVVKKIISKKGEVLLDNEPKLLKEINIVSTKTYVTLKEAMRLVVEDKKGTGRNARVENHSVGGKTGTAQVVSLSKYQDDQDSISQKWREHAIFAAMSPIENPEIVVLVYSQNDKFGGGGSSSAPVAQKIIKKYYELKKSRSDQSEALN